MSYLIVLTAAALGVAGVIFTRCNRFNILHPMSQILIWLIVLVGVAGLVDVAYRDDAVRQARRDADRAEARLKDIAAKPFDLSKPPVLSKFLIEFEEDGRPLTIPDFSGPFPSFGKIGLLGRIQIVIPGIPAEQADIVIGPDKTVRFVQTDAAGRALRDGEAGPWFSEAAGQHATAHAATGYGANLPSPMPLGRVMASIKANGQQPLGTLDLDIPNNAATRTFVSVNFERILPSLRFHLHQETPFDPCIAIVLIPMRFEIEPPATDARLRATLRLIERESMSVTCGKLPL